MPRSAVLIRARWARARSGFWSSRSRATWAIRMLARRLPGSSRSGSRSRSFRLVERLAAISGASPSWPADGLRPLAQDQGRAADQRREQQDEAGVAESRAAGRHRGGSDPGAAALRSIGSAGSVSPPMPPAAAAGPCAARRPAVGSAPPPRACPASRRPGSGCTAARRLRANAGRPARGSRSPHPNADGPSPAGPGRGRRRHCPGPSAPPAASSVPPGRSPPAPRRSCRGAPSGSRPPRSRAARSRYPLASASRPWAIRSRARFFQKSGRGSGIRSSRRVELDHAAGGLDRQLVVLQLWCAIASRVRPATSSPGRRISRSASSSDGCHRFIPIRTAASRFRARASSGRRHRISS